MSRPNWPEPIPFERRYGPTFPVEVLPPWVGVYVWQVAASVKTPVDLPALLSLAMLATACARKVVLAVQRDWLEPLNLYTVVALPPSNGKSPVFRKLLAPLAEHERAERSRLAPEIAAANARRRTVEKQLEATTDPEEADRLARELAELPKRGQPRTFVDDVTPEKLALMMGENGERMGLLSPEGGLFEAVGGRYSNVPNLDLLLKAYSGDPCQVDRLSRESVSLKAPSLTIGLTVQPSALAGFLSDEVALGRGLPARFLFAVPEPTLGRRVHDAEGVETEAARQDYAEGLLKLLRQPVPEEPKRLLLSEEARAEHLRFRQELEPRLGPAGDLGTGALLDWAGKLGGGLARVAGLLHLAEDGFQGEVSGETMRRALGLSECFIAHARCAFGASGGSPEERLAVSVLAKIRRDRLMRFSLRELQSRLGGGTASSVQLGGALRVLCERFFIARCDVGGSGTAGRPPSPAFEVNPRTHHSQNSQNSQNPFASSVSSVSASPVPLKRVAGKGGGQ